jgi:glutamyl-tRNA synthetase
VGSAHTALFNWLAARHAGGQLLLRVEDTNAAVYRPEYLDSILHTLEWLGIGFDDAPMFQSQQAERYATATEQLVASGHAYRCDCTPDEVKARTAGNPTPGYDGYCRDRNVVPGPSVAVRFRVPDEGVTAFDDVIHGPIEMRNESLEDFVIQRGDGTATFFLPNAVDDVEMGVTHVVRGADLINVTPRVLLIREALGYAERPVFAHLPLIVSAQGKKLSKRRDDLSVEAYRQRGYLPEAVVNYLALLGWGPPDGVEIRPVEEVVELFRLEQVVRSPAAFDTQKLDHVNGEYIRRLSVEEFTERARPWLGERADTETWRRLAPLVQERVVTLAEAPAMVDFLFEEPEMDEASWQKAMKPPAATLLDDALTTFEAAPWEAPALHDATQAVGERHGLKLAKAQAPIRVAVTGRTVGPPLFESLEALGRDTTLDRLRRARQRLGDG